jgi:hypothetical protein
MSIPAFRSVYTITTGATRDEEEERRRTIRLIAYWDEIRNGRSMPVEDDIDPDHEALQDIWYQCFIVQVRDFINEEFNYTYLGPGIIDAYREELVDHHESEIVSLQAAKLMDIYQQIMREKRPLIHCGEFTDSNGNLVKFRQCLLPFGRNDKVDVIFGHMTYQLFK